MTTEISTDLIISLPGVPNVATFTNEAEFDKLYDAILKKVNEHKHDVSTKKGRDEIKSLAHKISKTKVALDKQGFALTEEWRLNKKKVDATRNKIEERLVGLRTKFLQPLTDWETIEEARVEKHQQAVNALLAYVTMSADYPSGDLKDMRDAVEAVVVDDAWDEFQDRADLAKTDALAALDRLINVAERREADAAELEQLRAAQAERDRLDAQRRADEEAAAAEAKRIEDERLAEEKRKADIAVAAAAAASKAERDAAQRIADAEQAASDAQKRADDEIAAAAAEAERKVEADRKRIADEQEAEAAEQRRRDADRDHRKKVNNSIINALVECSGIADEQAMSIVIALVKGTIPNVTLKY
ncbi:hypothetical protein [Pararhizobium sp. DWP1-1-3]|uniref:hypothetical protein n=1 Tax=Pararhizobium sp. DWP1-1-3 TaxID=2804652 RepID=UPI003CEFFB86